MICGVCAIASGVGASAAGDGGSAGVLCGPSGARTLAAGSHARVYVSHGVVTGCARWPGGGRSERLGVTTSCIGADRVGPVVVAGTLAAFASERCGVDTGNTLVVVRNLRTGKRLSASDAASAPGPESFTSVDSLVARSDGAVAWIAAASSIGNHMTKIEVRRVDAHGPRLLDSGSAIVRGSLRLHRSRLTWTHGRQLRSSTLV
jgi:hypothetical protein